MASLWRPKENAIWESTGSESDAARIYEGWRAGAGGDFGDSELF